MKLTITAGIEIDDIADSDIDNAEKALVLLLELLLVEDLDGEDAVFCDSPVGAVSTSSAISERHYVHIKALIPVRVERLLYYARSPSLLAVDRGDGERVGKSCKDVKRPLEGSNGSGKFTEDIPLV